MLGLFMAKILKSILILGGNQEGRMGTANCISIRANALSMKWYIMKPKGYG
jgi:hypothetical protein